jgi:hypothetical protein
MSATVEELLADAQRRGLRVNNLFQRLCRVLWQANVCDADDKPFAFAVGHTAAEALERAIAKAPESAPATPSPLAGIPGPAAARAIEAAPDALDPFGDAPAPVAVAPVDEDPFA